MIGTLAVVLLVGSWVVATLAQYWSKRHYRARHAAAGTTHQTYPTYQPPAPIDGEAWSAEDFGAALDQALLCGHEESPAPLLSPPTQAMQLFEVNIEDGTGRHRIETRQGVDMAECPNCGEDVMFVRMAGGDGEIALDSTPDSSRGQVIVLGNECQFVTNPEDWKVVRAHNLPVYRRHNTHCSGFWHGRTRNIQG